MAWYPAHPETDEPLEADLDEDYEEDDEEPEPPGRPLTVARLSLAAKRAALRAPWLAASTTAVTGYGSDWLVRTLADNGEQSVSGAIALGACVAAPAAVVVVRIRHREHLGRRCVPDCEHLDRFGRWCPRCTRRLFWKSGGFYATWTAAMALGAPDWTLFSHPIGHDGMGVLLLTGTALLFRKWFARHEIELPADTPTPVLTAAEPEPEEEPPPPPPTFPKPPPPPDEGDLIKREWDIKVAGNIRVDGGPEEQVIAPGATLGADRTDLPHGYSWFVELPRHGSITARQLCQRREEIAFKLGRDQSHVLLELLEGAEHREHRLRLTVVTNDILKGKVPYLGPRYGADGRIPIGLYADGSGTAYWRTKDEKGPLGGLVVGGSGSGKSEHLLRIAMAMRAGGEFIVVVGDGDVDGRSAPLLRKVAYDLARGPEQVMRQLEAMEAWFNLRSKVTMGEHTTGPDGLPVPITDPDRQETVTKLMPCKRLPAWIWIIDEFYKLTRVLGRDFVQRVSDLRREIRKRGGNIIVGTQSPGLGDFAGDDVLQSQLIGDNVVLLRTQNPTDQYSVGDIGCDPTTLPDGGGYGFTNDPEGRKVLFRGEYAEQDVMARWVRDLPEYRPDTDSATVYGYKRPPVAVDPAADYHQAKADKAEILRRIAAGEPLPWEEQPEPDPAPAAWVVGGDGVAAAGNAGQADDDWSLPAAAPAAGAAGPGSRRPLNGSEVAVLDCLIATGHPMQNKQIADKTGLSEQAVSKALSRNEGKDGLVPRGLALRHQRGLHEVTAAGRDVAAASTPAAATQDEQHRMTTVLRLLGAQGGVGDDLVDAYLSGELPEEIRSLAEELAGQLGGAP